jgi:hypothetical protein
MKQLIARNTYFCLINEDRPDVFPEAIDVFSPKIYQFGKDFYVSVFRQLEENTSLSGYTFYLASHVPESLPEYGEKVILVVLQDESYKYRDYFNDIRCILRCLGTQAVYQDGFPFSRLQFAGLIHYCYKQFGRISSILKEVRKYRRLGLSEVQRKTLHIPLGFFSNFEPKPKPIMERSIDYAFLGSIGYGERFRNWKHYLMTPPKILSRNQMLAAFQKVSDKFKGKVYTTGDFFESIEHQASYEEVLADTKISVCPRGTSYETFRFFESCKAGCVVICEALPDVWFYKNQPAIILKDWSKLSSLIENLLNDEERLKAKSAESLMYWNTICEQNLAVSIARFIEPIENRVTFSQLSQIDPEIPSQASHRSFG